jgi:hypothetical protein
MNNEDQEIVGTSQPGAELHQNNYGGRPLGLGPGILGCRGKLWHLLYGKDWPGA